MIHLRPSPAVVAQETQDGICLFHTTREECHLLNATGAFLWSLLDSINGLPEKAGFTPDELAKELSAAYGLDYKTALADVMTFLTSAIESGIIVIG